MKQSFRSWGSIAGVGIMVAAVFIGPAGMAEAGPMAADHEMGASIRAHEGVSGQPRAAAQTAGLDVSHYQGTINWATVKSLGAKFAYIKATEGTTYHDPMFSTNYLQAYNQGIIRGAYH